MPTLVVLDPVHGGVTTSVRSRDPHSFIAPRGAVDVSDDPQAALCGTAEGQRKLRYRNGRLERKPVARLTLDREEIEADGRDAAVLTLEGEADGPVKVWLPDGQEVFMEVGDSVKLRASEPGVIGGRIVDDAVYADSDAPVGQARQRRRA